MFDSFFSLTSTLHLSLLCVLLCDLASCVCAISVALSPSVYAAASVFCPDLTSRSMFIGLSRVKRARSQHCNSQSNVMNCNNNAEFMCRINRYAFACCCCCCCIIEFETDRERERESVKGDARNNECMQTTKNTQTENLLPKPNHFCLTNFSANNFQTFFSRVARNAFGSDRCFRVLFGFFSLPCFGCHSSQVETILSFERTHKLNISNIFLRMIMLIKS